MHRNANMKKSMGSFSFVCISTQMMKALNNFRGDAAIPGKS